MLNLDVLKEKFNTLKNDYNFKTNDLRPKTFDEYIGNTDAVNLIKVTLLSCIKKGIPFPHTILSGLSGCGKSTLGYLIASYQKGEVISAGLPIKNEEWLELVAKLYPNYTEFTSDTLIKTCQGREELMDKSHFDVIILDEIHLQKQQPEILYSALEENIGIYKGDRIELPRFTTIGATTEMGEVKTPLRNRFTLGIRLSRLTMDNMKTIIRQGANKYEINITEDATNILAKASNSIPRDATTLLTRCRDLADAFDEDEIDEDIADTTFDLLKITRSGLNTSHIRYLSLLQETFKGDRIGLSTIAATLGENPSTISLTVEPQLLNLGFVLKTPRGRQISEKGTEYLYSVEARKLKE